MTHVCNSFCDYANKIEKLYSIEVHTFSGDVEIVDVYARNVDDAQMEAASMIGDVDYMVVLFSSVA